MREEELIGKIVKFGRYTRARSRDTVEINKFHLPCEITEVRYSLADDFFCVRISDYPDSLIVHSKDLLTARAAGSAKKIWSWNGWKVSRQEKCRNEFKENGKTFIASESRAAILTRSGFRELTNAADCFIYSDENNRRSSPLQTVRKFIEGDESDYEEIVYFSYDANHLAVFVK